MIKKILNWILGKDSSVPVKDAAAEAPYKIEPPAVTDAAWPFPDVRPEDAASAETAAVAEEKPAKKPRAKKAKAIETSTLDVTAKYKRADLSKMTKAELSELIAKHSLEIKSRATKDEMIQALLKV